MSTSCVASRHLRCSVPEFKTSRSWRASRGVKFVQAWSSTSSRRWSEELRVRPGQPIQFIVQASSARGQLSASSREGAASSSGRTRRVRSSSVYTPASGSVSRLPVFLSRGVQQRSRPHRVWRHVASGASSSASREVQDESSFRCRPLLSWSFQEQQIRSDQPRRAAAVQNHSRTSSAAATPSSGPLVHSRFQSHPLPLPNVLTVLLCFYAIFQGSASSHPRRWKYYSQCRQLVSGANFARHQRSCRMCRAVVHPCRWLSTTPASGIGSSSPALRSSTRGAMPVASVARVC